MLLFLIISSLLAGSRSASFDEFQYMCETDLASPQGLGFGGIEAERGKTPWLAALFLKKKYICGGSLISKDLILTAAHCLQGKAEKKPKDINTFEVILGAHNLHDKSESNRQVIKPKEFIIHPRWNYSAIKYENDIGMIRLSDLARYDSFVYPICLKKSGPIISDGKTVGWGAINDEENSFSPVPMVLELKASELINCIFEIDERLFAIASINSFCAKGSTAGVCKGDSGSSFYVKKNGKNFLQGIVSSNTRVKCSERGATLFMDVQKYIDFIRSNFEEVNNALSFNCEMDKNFYGKRIYVFLSQDFTECYANFDKFIYSREISKLEMDLQSSQYDRIESIVFERMEKLPKLKANSVTNTLRKLNQLTLNVNNIVVKANELSNFLSNFPHIIYLKIKGLKIDQTYDNIFNSLSNLKFLELEKSEFLSDFSENIFSGMKKLTYLSLSDNDLESLKTDFFKSNTVIESLILKNNLIQSISDRAFQNLNELSFLDLGYNEISQLPQNVFYELGDLEELYLNGNILTSISSGLFKKNLQLTILDLSQNEITSLPRTLFKNNSDLKEFYVNGNKLINVRIDFRTLQSISILHIGSSDECINELQLVSTNEIHSRAQLILSRC